MEAGAAGLTNAELVFVGPSQTPNGTLTLNESLPELATTSDREAFARLLAQAIFEWDTTLAVPLVGYISRVVPPQGP